MIDQCTCTCLLNSMSEVAASLTHLPWDKVVKDGLLYLPTQQDPLPVESSTNSAVILKLRKSVKLDNRSRLIFIKGRLTTTTHYSQSARSTESSQFHHLRIMSYRRLLCRALSRPTWLRCRSRFAVSVECPLPRHYSVVVEGPGDGQAPPLLAQARPTILSSDISDVSPKKTELLVERKVLAYPPAHYFDTHKFVTTLQQAGTT